MIDFTSKIREYFLKEIEVIQRLDLDEINKAMGTILNAYENDGRIYIFGNGGSAATASHYTVDFNKGISEKLEKKFRFHCLNDNVATLMAIANDLSYDDVFFFNYKTSFI